MKIRTWSYKEPKPVTGVGCLILKATNVRVMEIEPEFGILEQCWIYVYDLEIIKLR